MRQLMSLHQYSRTFDPSRTLETRLPLWSALGFCGGGAMCTIFRAAKKYRSVFGRTFGNSGRSYQSSTWFLCFGTAVKKTRILYALSFLSVENTNNPRRINPKCLNIKPANRNRMAENASFMERVKARKVELVALGTSVAVTVVSVAPASAFDINGTVGPLLDGIAALIPSIVSLIIAVVPAIIILALVSFVIGFLDEIIAMLKIRK